MSTQSQILAQRRRDLVLRSAAQRDALVMQIHSATGPLSRLDAGLGLLGKLKKNLGWIGGLAIGIVMIKPRRLSFLLQTATLALRTWRTAGPVLQALLARR